MGCVASTENNSNSTRSSLGGHANSAPIADARYANLKPQRKELVEWLDECGDISAECDFDGPTQDQHPTLSLYTYGIKNIRKGRAINYQNTNKGMKIDAYNCTCLYDAEQNPKSGAPLKNADLIKTQINFVGNDKLQTKNDRKCLINNKITLEIVTSCITRQYGSSLVGEVVDGKVDPNLVSEAGDQLQAYYEIYQKRFNEVASCGVCVSSGAKLISNKVNNIILLNVPEYQSDRVTNRLNIETATLNILDAALAMDVETLSIPAIAVKSRDYPVTESAEGMLYWIIEWCHLHNTGKLKTIKIVNSDPSITDQFKTTLHQILEQRQWVKQQDQLGM